MEKKREFNREECDTRYHIACAADADCADECGMKCPYEPKDKTE